MNISPSACPWQLILQEFCDVLNYSLSRVAFRIQASPSAVQKLVKYPNRTPRDKLFFALAEYYVKLFYGVRAHPAAKQYVDKNHHKTLSILLIELHQRGYFLMLAVDKNKSEESKFLLDKYLCQNHLLCGNQ